MTSQVPTVISSLTVEQWTQGLLDGFPATWTSPQARQPGGGTYGMFNAMAVNLKIINDYLVYAFDATRIETATGDALDLAAMDFYGDGLPRKTGESDDSYRARILAGLFIPYTTKAAFIQAITALTGVAPFLIEPWIAAQTSAYDWSYYDVNIPARPGLYGDPGLAYQAFVIATLPPASGQEQPTAIWGYDAGAAYDIYTGTYWNLLSQNFVSSADLDALIVRIKAFGITVWRQYISVGQLPFPLPASFSVATGIGVFPINIQPYNNQYIVIASGNWNSTYFVNNITNVNFNLETNDASPSGAILNYVIIPVSLPEVVAGAGFLPTNPGDIQAVLPAPVAPALPSNRFAATPSWNTDVWIDSIAPGAITVNFSTPAPAGATLSYYFFPFSQSALQYLTTIDMANASMFISVPNMGKACAYVTPSWNTQVAVTATASGIIAEFNTPPPADSFVQWGYFPIPPG